MIFLEKKNFKQNFVDFTKNCPLNPMSLPFPLNLKIFLVSPPWCEVPCETLLETLSLKPASPARGPSRKLSRKVAKSPEKILSH
jgi:hypothetical protein